MRIDPKCGVCSFAQKVATLTGAVITLIKPKFYIRRRVAEGKAFCKACAVAYAVGEYSMHRCRSVDICHLGVCRHKEPHRQILGAPLVAIFGLLGGVVCHDKVASCQRRAVLHAPIVQERIERGVPLACRKVTYKCAFVISSLGKGVAESDIGVLLQECHLLCQAVAVAPIVVAIAEGDIFALCSLHTTAIVLAPADILG